MYNGQGCTAHRGRALSFPEQHFQPFAENNGETTTLCQNFIGLFLSKHTEKHKLVGLKTTLSRDRNCEERTNLGGTSPAHKL